LPAVLFCTITVVFSGTTAGDAAGGDAGGVVSVATGLGDAAAVVSAGGGGLGVAATTVSFAAGVVAAAFVSCRSCLEATGEAARHSKTLAARHRDIARMPADRRFHLRPARI
jgi:hypothetical protein